MIRDYDLTDKKIIGIFKQMREIFGQKAFSVGIKNALIERKRKVQQYFKSEQTLFESSNDGETLKRNLIYTDDRDVLLDFICVERNIDKNSAALAVGMDSGQKRMLVTLTVDGLEKETDDESLTKGINFKETSTKKVIILAHVDDIPETYENISKILSKLNIHNLYLEYKLVADLKLYNIILGLTTCSSRHTCYICKSFKNENGVWTHAEHRTLKNLLQDQEMWENRSGDRNDLKIIIMLNLNL